MTKKIAYIGVRLALVAALVLLSSCSGLRRKTLIQSEPSGATIYVDGKLSGKTPYLLHSSDTVEAIDLELVLAGYEKRSWRHSKKNIGFHAGVLLIFPAWPLTLPILLFDPLYIEIPWYDRIYLFERPKLFFFNQDSVLVSLDPLRPTNSTTPQLHPFADSLEVSLDWQCEQNPSQIWEEWCPPLKIKSFCIDETQRRAFYREGIPSSPKTDSTKNIPLKRLNFLNVWEKGRCDHIVLYRQVFTLAGLLTGATQDWQCFEREQESCGKDTFFGGVLGLSVGLLTELTLNHYCLKDQTVFLEELKQNYSCPQQIPETPE